MFEHLRKPWKRLIAPIARGLVSIGVTANVVTIVGAAGTVLVSIITGITGWLLPGAIVLTILVIFDSLDGSVAALSGGGTQFGAFLDSTLDRIADWAILAGVIIFFHRLIATSSSNDINYWPEIGMYAALFSVMTSFVTSYARARAEAEGFDAKNGIATRSDRLVIILVGMALTGVGLPPAILACCMILLAILGVVTVWQRIWHVSQSMSTSPKPADPSHE
ncbi:phosphatidylinositol phosphate synthase [Bifidobacterium sp.]|jgi:CDP-diacylglycerol--glycerol-3-phosphate 3-phosphatidyltransferase|uniref:phosphatidylinositol phosphate synthase n=1 Tax=Bifidobacterium sp. TaxID=41200 RepID=UPI0025BE8D58|nr:CDP-alcohol phosphatidyltransferase family protein [Bifidobacterium sp.]MCH4160193.1 CDP-alcohol phosphatidyltransferase family protein [Bifidobacterium sp.]MCH4174336.1 CDP-alcohol phosphatidyltransferase family protein [Bifidobacterium sp.]MCI1635746.1 CDP-alcohol phosphatidyltransferase family protein [Bifidobacterium sp.]